MSTFQKPSLSHVLPCPACGTLNRVAAARLQDRPLCADCKAALLPEHPVELSGESFDRYIGRATLPVLVDFWAPWCGPCRTMAPHFAAAAHELWSKVLLAKLNTELAPAIGQRLAIQAIPTMVLFEGGLERARTSGALSKKQILDWVAPRRSS